jgi:cellulose synthase (UDP-forming)
MRSWGRRAASAAAVAAGVWYVAWRSSTLEGTGALGVAFYVAEAATFALLVASAILIGRIRAPRQGPTAPPSGTLDVFVTVCGEPVEMVERTLRAALAIEYPHETYVLNDGRVAGHPEWPLIEELAARYGVTCFTREEGARGKAGNLNHALACTRGDFVVTIDADHVADADLAEQTLGYFADELIAFVCSSQRFELGRDVLNNQEHFFYEFLQPAKDVDWAAFSCGNGTVYRRSALDSIGGFSEWNLVEDLHTSYVLHAAGWRSVYHPRPLTLGTAPKTPAVFLKQRTRWALDATRLLVWDSPLWKRGLNPMHRVHYLHMTSFYPLTALQVFLMLGAPLYIFGRVSLVNAPTGPYLWHAVPYFIGILGFLTAHGGPRSAVRVLQSSVFAAPGYVIATVYAVLRIPPDASPSEKGRQRWFSPLLLAPAALFAVLVASVAYTAVDDSPARSAVAVFWSTFLAFLLSGPLTALADRPTLEHAANWLTRLAVAGGGAVLLAFDLIPEALSHPAAPVSACLSAPAPQADGRAAARLEPPRHGAYLGASAPGLPDCTDALERWNSKVGRSLAIVHWYQRWHAPDSEFPTASVADVAAHEAVPMISWEPWSGDAHASAISLQAIAGGRQDRYVRAWAKEAAEYGQPILLRPMHAMNGNWFPWAVTERGNSPRLFVQAWRRIHRLFEQEGATNVSWVWSVSSFSGLVRDNRDLRTYYPGAAYVDWVGLSAFNWGTTDAFGAWRSPDALLGPTYRALAPFGKPIMVAEIGTVDEGGDPTAWVRRALRAAEREYPRLDALVWFDYRQTPRADFRIRGSLATAMRAEVVRSRHWDAHPAVTPSA